MNQISTDTVRAAFADRFAIISAHGRGGQGVVLRARRSLSQDGRAVNDDVALKLYYDRSQDERVLREVAALKRIRHPNLANVVEFGEVDLRLAERVRYVAWEFVEGEPLSSRILSGRLPALTVAVVGRDVAIAIDAIWSSRIVHRDVNPKNIMLRVGDRNAVLIDLGLARHLAEPSLSAINTTCGTFGYLSPEQVRYERRLTCMSDIFALGIVLQEALAGAHPTGGDQGRLLRSPPKTADVAPLAPGAMSTLVDRMLDSRPAFRPVPADVAAAMAAILEAS